MIIPVRCFTCGKVFNFEYYEKKIIKMFFEGYRKQME